MGDCAWLQIEAEEREEIFKGHAVYLEQRRERELEREKERHRELEEAAERKVRFCEVAQGSSPRFCGVARVAYPKIDLHVTACLLCM